MKKVNVTNYNKCIKVVTFLNIAFKTNSNYSLPLKLYFQDGQEISIHVTIKEQMYNILVKDSTFLENKYINHAILENNRIQFINI